MSERRSWMRKYPMLGRRWTWRIFLGFPLAVLLLTVLSNELTFLRYEVGVLGCNCMGRENIQRRPIILSVFGGLYDGLVVSVNSLRSAFDTGRVPADENIPDVHLRVPANSINELGSNLPYSAKAKYHKAWLKYPDGKWKRAEFRFRGRNIWHWQPEKPSLRIKLKRNAPLNLQRHINLVNPEDRPMLSNLLGERLAIKLGLLTHDTQFVRLFINREYRGLYHWTTREDESLLRLRKRIPGPMFVGEHLKRRWAAEQFEIEGDKDVLDRFNPIEKMIEAIYSPVSPQRYAALWNILSMDKFARWVAAINLAGSTHTDFNHNHLYYFDPSSGLIEPIVTDINGHGMLHFPGGGDRVFSDFIPDHTTPLNDRIQPLLDAALRDPHFYHLRNKILYAALHGSASVEAQSTLVKDLSRSIDSSVRADRNKAALQDTNVSWFRIPYSNGQYEESKQILLDWIKHRNSFLKAELERLNVKVVVSPNVRDGKRLVAIEVDGNASVIFSPKITKFQVWADRNLSGKPSELISGPIRLYPGLAEDHKFSHKFTAIQRVPSHYLRPAPQSYLFSITAPPGLAISEIAKRLAGSFQHGLSESAIQPTIIESVPIDVSTIYKKNASLHSWHIPSPKQDTIHMGPGIVDLSTSLVVLEHQNLFVSPGTTLRLGHGVSIFSKGKVEFSGTNARPIVVKRLNQKKPWGVLAIQGPNSSGSSFRHTQISGGSLAEQFNVRYSGMVSAHWSDDLTIEDTEISENSLSDDTLHIVHGTFTLSRSQISNCFSDCIDVDYATGDAKNITIQNAHNDGFDFMTSNVSLVNVQINGAGDKGLSVGEKSEVTAVHLSVRNASIGIASKDKSQIRIENAQFLNNGVALDSFTKNWRYGGPGNIVVKTTRFSENEVNLRTEEGGETTFFDQPTPERTIGDGRVETRSSSKS